MMGQSYELPQDITALGGMVTWADENEKWHTEVFEFLIDARKAFIEHTKRGDVAYMSRLVGLNRAQAFDFTRPLAYIDPAPGAWPFGQSLLGPWR